MSMSSATSKHEDHQLDTPPNEKAAHSPYPSDDAPITFRSWAYALLGCFLYFVISFNLAATSQFRTAQGSFLDPKQDSIWLLNVVSIFQASLGPLIMSLSDVLGRRYPLIIIAALAVVGTAVSASATSFNMALAGQSLASIGLATVGAGYAIPSEVMPRKWRGGVQCAVNGFASFGGGAGVLATGGLLRGNPTEGWRTAGHICTGLWAAFFIASLFYFPPPRPVPESQRHLSTAQKIKSLDWIGYFLLCAGLCLFLVGTTQGGNNGWTVGSTLGPLISGLVVVLGFCLYEWKGTTTGLCAHELFQNRNYPLTMLAVAIEGAIMFGLLGFFGVAAISLWTQDVFIASAYTSPFYLVSIPFFGLLIWYTTKFKEFKIPLTIGYILYLAAMIGLVFTNRNSGGAAWGYITLTGIGFSAPIALLVAVGQLSTPGHAIGAASALLVSMRAIGAAVALSIYGAVLSQKLAHDIPAGITAGAFKGGLQPQQAATILPQLIPAIASQNAQVIASAFRIPGITPGIVVEAIHGMQDGMAHGLKFVWIIASVFSAVGILSVLLLKSSKELMTNQVDAPAQKKHAEVHA